MTEEVGYGRPPSHSRWQKGQSGNPRGRPKGTPNFANDLAAELGEKIQVTEGGVTKTITKQQALLKSLMTRGIKGDVRAAQLMITWALASSAQPEGKSALPPLSPDQLKLMKHYLSRQPSPPEEQI